jgi:hypothetical protein
MNLSISNRMLAQLCSMQNVHQNSRATAFDRSRSLIEECVSSRMWTTLKTDLFTDHVLYTCKCVPRYNLV